MKEVTALPKAQYSTTIVICPSLKSFEIYLDALAIIESLIESEGYEDKVQVASFHPDYKFEGITDRYVR